ncbi:calcitonin receptor [Saccopteryx leptura]|uniref:calcitonin receptor n=1 Tax=Saccopteryx leptura TaxID=249018 RepID=UPI00339C6AC5
MRLKVNAWCFILLLLLNYLTRVRPTSVNDTYPPTTDAEPFLYVVGRRRLRDAQERCFKRMQEMPPYQGKGPFCNRTWDGWLCWDDTPAGITSHQQCPDYFPDFDVTESVSKYCDENGVWYKNPEKNETETNYSMCNAFTPEKLQNAFILYYLALVGHSISISTLVTALAIFTYFKNLSCQRVTMHKHMFLTYILNSLIVIIHLVEVVPNGDLVQMNPLSCKILHFFNHYMMACNYFWMLCEGIYLHSLIMVAVFTDKHHMKWYYLLGWGFPLVPTTIHAITRTMYFNDNCWLSVETHLLYIIHGPVMAALVINFFFLLNIVRVLVKKMREAQQADFHMYLKAVRATLFLVPLLGVQFVVFPWRPSNQTLGKIYDYVMHTLIHFQGFFVAVIYCFYNSNVQETLKRHWKLMKLQWEQRYGRRHNARHIEFNAAVAYAAAAFDAEESGLPLYICHNEPRNQPASIRLGEERFEAIPMEIFERESCA